MNSAALHTWWAVVISFKGFQANLVEAPMKGSLKNISFMLAGPINKDESFFHANIWISLIKQILLHTNDKDVEPMKGVIIHSC